MTSATIDDPSQRTIGDSFAWAVRQLRAAGIDNARLDARVLLETATERRGGAILAWREQPLSDTQWQRFAADIGRRRAREPLARILGEKEFWGLTFRVDRHTLVPRPDSETLVEAALAACPDRNEEASVLDFGTGSGCLLLSILAERPRFTGIGIDAAPGAVAVAQQNARRLGLIDRAAFVAADWGAPLIGRHRLILSNPPYIPDGEIANLDQEVKNFDPHLALAGGDDGLTAFAAMATSAVGLLADGGTLIIEIGATQAAAAKRCLEGLGLAVLEIRQDLGGRDRCVIARTL